MEHIGILGGTFNPVHEAHVKLGEYFIKETKANKVIYVPCNISPFKTDEKIASPEHRLRMLNIALREINQFEISKFELSKEGISYSFETVNYFHNKFPDAKLSLILGGDQAENFHKWKNWKDILDLADLYVALRKGYKIPTYEFEGYKKAVYMEMPFIEVSASEIRNKISQKELNIKHLDSKVEEYIYQEGIY